jgi:hypothetical protein
MRYIFLVLLTLTFCDSIKSETDPDFRSLSLERGDLELSKVRTVTLQEVDSVSIGAPLYSVEVDKKGRMFFFDTIENKFVVYERDGTLVKSFSNSGRGPLEFERVYAFTIDTEDNLVVYDDSQRLIKIFDKDFTLKEIFEVDNKRYFISSHDLEIYDGKIITGIVKAEVANNRMKPELLVASPNTVLIPIDQPENILFKGNYDPHLLRIKSRYNRPLLALDDQEKVLFTSHQNSYRIQEFDLASYQRISYFGYKQETYGEGLVELSQTSENRRENYLKSLNESSNEKLFFTDRYVGNFYINGTEEWYDSKDLNDLSYHLAVYDRNTKGLRDVFKVDYRLIGVHGGQLYFIEDENPENFKIGVYELD